MEDYVKFLTAFVNDLGLNVDNADYVRQRDDGHTPLTIDGRRLVLPTMTHRRSMSDDKILLHPVAENVLSELSPVTRTLLKVAGCNLNIMFIIYGTELVQVASDTGRQANLTNKQLDLLDNLRSCTSSEEKDMSRIIQKFLMGLYNENQSGAFIRLGLSRGRIYRGSKRHRVGSVVFPLYEELIADREKSRKESKHGLAEDVRETIIELHEAMFPACSEEEAYGFCEITSRNVAPFFVTFAKTYGQMGAEFRRIQEILTGLVTFTQEDEAPRGDWSAYLDDGEQLRKWMNAIPDTNGYNGPATEDEEVTSSVTKEEATVSYMGPRVLNSQGQLEELPPPAQVTEKTRANQPTSKVDYIDPQDFARRFGGTNSFSVSQTANTAIKRYIDGYAKFWDKHVATYRIAPHGMPHPQQIAKGMLPPSYEGAPALPAGFYPGGSATTAMMPTIPMAGMMMPQQGMMMTQQGMVYPQQGMMMPQQGMLYAQGGMMMPQGGVMIPQQGMMMPQGGMMMGTSVNPMMNPAMNPNIHPAMVAVGAGGGSVAPGTI